MFNQCKTPEELAIISKKIASLAKTTSKRSKSDQDESSQTRSISDHAMDLMILMNSFFKKLRKNDYIDPYVWMNYKNIGP